MIDERSGVIVMGRDVRVSTVAVAQGKLTVTIGGSTAGQPARTILHGRTVVVPRTKIGVQEDGKQLAIMKKASRCNNFVDGLNALGLSPRDLMAILQAIKAAGRHPGRNRGDVMASSIDMNAASSVKSAYALLGTERKRRRQRTPAAPNEKAMNAAQDFEAVFLNSMFSQMFTSVDGEGPFGGDQSTGVWRAPSSPMNMPSRSPSRGGISTRLGRLYPRLCCLRAAGRQQHRTACQRRTSRGDARTPQSQMPPWANLAAVMDAIVHIVEQKHRSCGPRQTR